MISDNESDSEESKTVTPISQPSAGKALWRNNHFRPRKEKKNLLKLFGLPS
jgi:hypothetical protein